MVKKTCSACHKTRHAVQQLSLVFQTDNKQLRRKNNSRTEVDLKQWLNKNFPYFQGAEQTKMVQGIRVFFRANELYGKHGHVAVKKILDLTKQVGESLGKAVSDTPQEHVFLTNGALFKKDADGKRLLLEQDSLMLALGYNPKTIPIPFDLESLKTWHAQTQISPATLTFPNKPSAVPPPPPLSEHKSAVPPPPPSLLSVEEQMFGILKKWQHELTGMYQKLHAGPSTPDQQTEYLKTIAACYTLVELYSR